MEKIKNQSEVDSWEESRARMEQDIGRSRRELDEINLLLEQSEIEVDKLARRNGTISVQLQQIHDQFETIPREDIRSTYDNAMDIQQRLFVMHGQLEKLQSDRVHLVKKIELMEQFLTVLKEGAPVSGHKENPGRTRETLEMMIQAQEAERQRLSRQMHDGPAQALSNFILQTEIAMRLFDMDQSKARDELLNLKAGATATFQKIRDFIFDLRPMMLDDLGLIPTVKRYVEAINEKTSIDVRLILTGTERRLEPYLEVMLFRALQELLTNAAYHSQASQIKIHMDVTDTQLSVEVEDNGKGFDAENLEIEGGMGLKVIKDRVELVGGDFDLRSALGDGTHVTFQVPTHTH